MRRFLKALPFITLLLSLLGVSSEALATCTGPAGIPFNCTAAVNGPSYNDLVLGGVTSGAQNGQTVQWTWGQIFTGTTLTSPVIINGTIGGTTTFNGVANLSAGGSLAGTFTGSPTFSGSPIFSGGGSLAGTFTGSPTFNGSPIFSGGGLGALAINSDAWLSKFGWINVDANGTGTITWSSGTPGIPIVIASANVGGQAGGSTSPTQYQFNVPSDFLDSSLTGNGYFSLASTTNVTNGAKGAHAGVLFDVTQAGTMTTTANTQGIDVLNTWMTINGAGVNNAIVQNPQLVVTNTATGVNLAELIEGGLSVASGVVGVNIRGGVTMASAGGTNGTSADYAYAATSTGGNVPWGTGFQVGRYDGPWPITSGGTLFGTQVQTNAIGWTNHTAAYGLRISDVAYSGAAIWTPGYQVGPDGTQYIGTGTIAPAATGLAIDAKNYVGSTPTISNAGVSYAGTDILYDETYGAIALPLTGQETLRDLRSSGRLMHMEAPEQPRLH